jgi:hypothetical protein
MLPAMNEKPTTFTAENRCKRCGSRERYHSNRACVTCCRERSRKWWKKHGDEYNRAWAGRKTRELTPTPEEFPTDPMEGLL